MRFKEFLAEGIKDKGIFKAVFMAGTPGAGKSYTIKQVSGGDISPRIVNTDKFIEFLAKKKNLSLKHGWLEKFWQSHEDTTKKLTRNQLRSYLNGALPIFVDGTSSDINNLIARAGVLESLGYDVGMIFVNTSFDTAIKRIEKRERSVDRSYVEEFYKLADENKKFYSGKFDFFIEINNDDDELTDEIVLSAYRKTSKFFNGELKNPIGRRVIEKLTAEKKIELVPEILKMDELDRKLDIWYRD